MNEEIISSFLNEYNYDIRTNENGSRWIDQKCTMDVLCLVSDCIMEYTQGNVFKEFSVNDIWYSDYSSKNVQQIFSKPNPAQKASREYDKYFGQPIKLLAYAKVLDCVGKRGRANAYKIARRDILEYISFRERNAHSFLCLYIEKVLKDSELYNDFSTFFEVQNEDAYEHLRNAYGRYILYYTAIKGQYEWKRIFPKVLNPLAYKYKKYGSEKGAISKDIITWDMLMYNQKNWRDINKPKDMTREDFSQTSIQVDYAANYRIQKAKRKLKEFNDKYRLGISEVRESGQMKDKATNAHHIFPESVFPEIADYLENLIMLTPSQHMTKAHPDNNTKLISREYQYLCLISKAGIIKENTTQNVIPVIYDFYLFLNVLSVGLHSEDFYYIENGNYDALLSKIDEFY